MHELPQLRKLERKYRQELVVIGVQSPKYPAESKPETLRHAVHRLGIEHPVVNDPDFKVWDSYTVKAWPTLVFISPRGEVIGSHAGEAPFEALDRVVAQIAHEYERDGALVRDSVAVHPVPFSDPGEVLAFPGNVVATEQGLFVSDSGHHQILRLDFDGLILDVVGQSTPGLADGPLESSRFNSPQGMAIDVQNHVLYVADAGNHCIRAVDLSQRHVRTVAGTGQQAVNRIRRGAANHTLLSSPWDLALEENFLYIAMAGRHQIWMFDRKEDTVGVWAGTGHEATRDGQREQAWFAQPMALSLSSGRLYVTCAESQAVREIDSESGEVRTLVGGGLFDFGDQDGDHIDVRLQHPQGTAARGDTIFIADTYNNKVKVVNRKDGTVSTLAGSGTPGMLDGPGSNARFSEPTGLSYFQNVLYVADTNNHRIRMLDLDTHNVRTLNIHGMAHARRMAGQS